MSRHPGRRRPLRSLLNAKAQSASARTACSRSALKASFRTSASISIAWTAPSTWYWKQRARAYPSFDVPFHSRWRHFGPSSGMIDGPPPLGRPIGLIAAARARAEFDLAILSVFLDAGAGPSWRYHDPETGSAIGRSKGWGLASLAMFTSGAFSAIPLSRAVANRRTLPAVFHQSPGQRVVRGRRDPASSRSHGGRHTKRRLLRAMIQITEVFTNSQATIQPADPKTEPNPWLERTGWAQTQGFEPEEIVQWIRPVTDEETVLKVIKPIFEQVANTARRMSSSRTIATTVRFDMNRKKAEDRPDKPFESQMEGDSWIRYKEVWWKVICFMFRTQDASEEDRPPYELTSKQARLFTQLRDQAGRQNTDPTLEAARIRR